MPFWESVSDAFSKDGSATRFFEKLPVIGYVAAGAQAIAGNTEQAKRAAASSTNGLLTTAGAVVGGLVGGPPGVIVGASLGSAAGIGAEHGISQTINDPNVKKDVGNVSVERFVIEGALSAVSAGIGGGGAGQILSNTVKEAAKSSGKTALMAGLGSVAGKTVTPSYTNDKQTPNTQPGQSTQLVKENLSLSQQLMFQPVLDPGFDALVKGQPQTDFPGYPDWPSDADTEPPSSPEPRRITALQHAAARAFEARIVQTINTMPAGLPNNADQALIQALGILNGPLAGIVVNQLWVPANGAWVVGRDQFTVQWDNIIGGLNIALLTNVQLVALTTAATRLRGCIRSLNLTMSFQ